MVSMPPPNVTGALHMGHAMFVTLEVSAARLRLRPVSVRTHSLSLFRKVISLGMTCCALLLLLPLPAVLRLLCGAVVRT